MRKSTQQQISRRAVDSAGRLPLAIAVAIATGALALLGGSAGATGSAPSVELLPLAAAETWSDHGVDPALERKSGTVRVRILLRSQPLLEAASSDRFQDLAQPAPDPGAQNAAAAHPGRITGTEKAAARAGERSYERAVDSIDSTAAESSEDLDYVAAEIRSSGGVVLDRELIPAAVIARVDIDELDQVNRVAGVQAVDPDPVEKPLSGIGTQAVGAPSWWAAGYTGGTGTSDTVPADAGVIGEVPDPTHPAFAGVTVDNFPSYTPGDHGTHTAGIIASGDSTYRGVAYGVDRLVNGDDPYVFGFSYLGVPGAADPAEVINTSFGGPASSDDEDDGDDITTAFFGISEALPAGNENADPGVIFGSPTVGNIGRNTINVAGYNDVGTVDSTDDVVLGFSSRGPTPGGRKKPDLTAPGGAVIAPSIRWNSPPPCGAEGTDPDGTCADYSGMSGTSFSSPHVAGAMTLLEGANIGDPMAQRAILINSARDWGGTNTGLHGWTSGNQTGWRPEVGWGELDLDTALAQRADYKLGSVPAGEAAFYRATVPAGSKATMAFQLRGYFSTYPAPGQAGSFQYTQSNLDLHQYDSTGAEVAAQPPFDPPDTTIDPGPNAIDPNDTVEQVRSPASPGSQSVTYKVEAASQVDGAAAEPFAIAGAAPLAELQAPVVRPNVLTGSPSGPVNCTTPVVISTTLRNDSPDIAAAAAVVGIELPAGVQLVSGTQTQGVAGGTLTTSTTSESHNWTVQATTDGPKTITVAGVGEGYGTPFRRTATVTIDADCVAPDASIDSGPAGLTNDASPSFAFSAQGGATSFECSLDGTAFTACTSPYGSSQLADGAHALAVRARDAVGNLDPSPATRSFTVDTVAPDTSIDSGPSGSTRSATPSFALSGAGATRFECSIDGKAFAPCSSPASSGALGDGRHTFAARAIDAAGNIDPTPASRGFEIDRKVSGLKLRAKKKQRFKRSLAVKIKAALGEPGTVRVSANAKLGRKMIKAKKANAKLGGGREKLRLGASRSVNREIARALRGGGKVKLSVKATFTDTLGNRQVVKRSITLR